MSKDIVYCFSRCGNTECEQNGVHAPRDWGDRWELKASDCERFIVIDEKWVKKYDV